MGSDRIVYTDTNGKVCVVVPVFDGQVETVAKKSVPAGLDYYVTSADSIPRDRYFREAWEINSNAVTVNMGKARLIHLDNIRKVRDEKLKELDIEQLKGKDVEAQKQLLRDVPQSVNLASAETPDELKAIWPSELI